MKLEIKKRSVPNELITMKDAKSEMNCVSFKRLRQAVFKDPECNKVSKILINSEERQYFTFEYLNDLITYTLIP